MIAAVPIAVEAVEVAAPVVAAEAAQVVTAVEGTAVGQTVVSAIGNLAARATAAGGEILTGVTPFLHRVGEYATQGLAFALTGVGVQLGSQYVVQKMHEEENERRRQEVLSRLAALQHNPAHAIKRKK